MGNTAAIYMICTDYWSIFPWYLETLVLILPTTHMVIAQIRYSHWWRTEMKWKTKMKLASVEHLPLSAQTAIFSASDLQEFCFGICLGFFVCFQKTKQKTVLRNINGSVTLDWKTSQDDWNEFSFTFGIWSNQLVWDHFCSLVTW